MGGNIRSCHYFPPPQCIWAGHGREHVIRSCDMDEKTMRGNPGDHRFPHSGQRGGDEGFIYIDDFVEASTEVIKRESI